MAAWTAAAARAETVPAPRPERARAVPRTRTRARKRHVPGGVLWIAVLAILLAGVVAMNVAVLRLNMTLDRLGRERAQLRADNAALFSQLSSAAATGRIQQLAAHRLGYVPATSEQTSYVQLTR
jgi:cell division protein FtsL